MERLLDYFVPENYQINLKINKTTEKVEGHATITGVAQGDLIKLNSVRLKISAVTLNGAPADFTVSDEYLEIKGSEFNQKVTIEVDYAHDLNRNMVGTYLSTYNYDGHEERIVGTQFESHYAREAFPCVDEPAAKATFDLTISDYDKEDTILSNMPAKSEKDEGEYKTVVFETTPKMSTYLVAFVLGRFNSVSTHSLHGVKVTTYAALNHSKSSVKFANDIAAASLDFYDDSFGVPYPLPKMDQVALPDFEAGAMENWGLVTYREACLLVEKDSSLSDKKYVAIVVAHELSHQWFGDLVTMAWWDNLWLNESFANMMEYYCIDHLHPEWNVWEDFFTSDALMALRRDALASVQAVQQEVKNPVEIAMLFDGAIVYAKGARLMLMLMRLMGDKKFLSGLKKYFKKHQYGNTSGDDLWAALQDYADFDVKEFMDAWILQPGYPMLTDGAQQRFLLSGGTDETKWPLPKITDDMSGHYIICLSGVEFEQKIRNFNNLNLEQKLRLLIDRQMLSKTPLVSTGSLMDLLPKFKEETSAAVFEIVADVMSSLKIFCDPESEYYPKLQQYIYNIVSPNLERLGYEPKKGEDDNETRLRSLCLGFAIYSRKEEVLDALTKIYDRDIKIVDGKRDYTGINSEIRGSVISAKFLTSDEEILSDLIEDYQVESDPNIKSELLSAASMAKKPRNINTLIGLLEKPEVVKPQDHIYLFAYLLSNFYAKDRTYDWLYGHYEYIKQITSDKSIDDYVRIGAARIVNMDQRDKYFEFFDPKREEPGLERSIELAHQDVAARLRWIQEDTEGVHRRLSEAQ